MTEQNHLCRVWDIIEKVGVCMLTTQFAGGLRARPIEPHAINGHPDRACQGLVSDPVSVSGAVGSLLSPR